MIYVFLTDGFEEMEAIAPIDILRRASCEVRTVGIGASVATGAHGVPVQTDTSEISLNGDVEMIVLPGGSGYTRLEASDMVADAIDYCVKNNIPVAAICAAPTILGKRGLLRGKHAVCFPGMESGLIGAQVSNDGVVTDGIFTTGKSAGYATEFALRLVQVLRGEAVAKKLASSLCIDD